MRPAAVERGERLAVSRAARALEERPHHPIRSRTLRACAASRRRNPARRVECRDLRCAPASARRWRARRDSCRPPPAGNRVQGAGGRGRESRQGLAPHNGKRRAEAAASVKFRESLRTVVVSDTDRPGRRTGVHGARDVPALRWSAWPPAALRGASRRSLRRSPGSSHTSRLRRASGLRRSCG